MPYVEYLRPEFFSSAIRRGATRPEPPLENGRFALPTAPGLGIELCDDAIARLRFAG